MEELTGSGEPASATALDVEVECEPSNTEINLLDLPMFVVSLNQIISTVRQQ